MTGHDTCACARSRRVSIAAGVAAVIGIAWAGQAGAVDTNWTNATGNALWNDPLNWSNGVPTSADTARINAAGSILLPTSPPAVALRVQRGFSNFGSIQFDGGRLVTSRVDNTSPSAPFRIDSDLGAPGDALALLSINAGGTIGDGAGGGSFELLAINSRLRGAATTGGRVVVFQSFLEDGGSIGSASAVDWVGSSTITVSTASPPVNRLPDSAVIRLISGSLNFNAAPAGASNIDESAGTLDLGLGRSSVQLQGPSSGGSLVLTSAGLTRQPGTVMRSSGSSNAQLRFTSPPAGLDGPAPTDRAVLGFGIGTSSDAGATPRASFLTYDRGVDPTNINDDPGLRPLDFASEYATSIGAGGNVLIDGSASVHSAAFVRSLNLVNGSLQVNGDALNVTSSGIIMQGDGGSRITGTGSLTLGGEARIMTFNTGSPHQIDVPVHAALFTKGGNGELVLSQPNVIPGATYIAEGTLTTRTAGALGTVKVVLGGGALRVEHPAETIAQLTVLGYRRSTSIGNFGLGSGGGTISTAPGTSVTINNAVGGGAVQLGGDGMVHLPPGSEAHADFWVYGGEFRVDGTLIEIGDDDSSVILAGGTVIGGGSVSGSVSAQDFRGGVLAPGPGTARITCGFFSFGSSIPPQMPHVLRMDLAGTADGAYDQIRALDVVFLDDFVLDVSVNYDAQFGDDFRIIDNASSSSIFPLPSNLPEGSTLFADGHQFRITYVGGDGNDVVLTVVPEPASVGVTAILAAIASRRHVRRRRCAAG